ncbi:MAG: hypothetical protein WA208_20530 [Thermoanaerobaculia bacterium]
MARRNRVPALFLALFLATSVQAADRVDLVRLSSSSPSIAELGRGVGIVFTPDLSVPDNCAFYEALGFACFQSADWAAVLDEIRRNNEMAPEETIHTLVLETHGTNGNGLKLQESKQPNAPRSYISVAALQERLEPAGVEHVILSACNSGRLLRPSIYRKLDRNPGDRLFLPPTLGVIDASGQFDPARTPVRILAPAESHIETTILASPAELGPAARNELRAIALERGIPLPRTFAISDLLMKILIGDRTLTLRVARPVTELSNRASSPEESERLFEAFVSLLDSVALRAAERANLAPVSDPRSVSN